MPLRFEPLLIAQVFDIGSQRSVSRNRYSGYITLIVTFACQMRSITFTFPLTAHCQWEEEVVRERTGHTPSYAETKKMKSITLHTHGCPKEWLFSSSSSSSSS